MVCYKLRTSGADRKRSQVVACQEQRVMSIAQRLPRMLLLGGGLHDYTCYRASSKVWPSIGQKRLQMDAGVQLASRATEISMLQ